MQYICFSDLFQLLDMKDFPVGGSPGFSLHSECQAATPCAGAWLEQGGDGCCWDSAQSPAGLSPSMYFL